MAAIAESGTPRPLSGPLVDDESRWRAITSRDPAADGVFVYSVRTTGVYCRPTCPARRPRRANVRFHATCEEAESAGFRPCRRCRPADEGLATRRADLVARACRLIEQADDLPNLNDLAQAVGLSDSHFQRVFKAHTGVTPRGYAIMLRSQRVQDELARRRTVTEAVYAAGYGSSGRFYESTDQLIGMTPGAFRAGGRGVTIRHAIGASWLGPVLVAATDRGICAILLGDDPDELVVELRRRFPEAEFINGDADFGRLIAQVVGFLEAPAAGLDLPLDIHGTAFQRRVWEILQRIPAGSTASYAEVAEAIGQPGSARAVASACGANALAVAIPCHRVVRSDGSLSGYRWGVDRKFRLLRRERGEPD